MNSRNIDFDGIARIALLRAHDILGRWLPDGSVHGREYISRNPRRDDHRYGSFKVNLDTGRWADFATGDRGGDLISLAAYLDDLNQSVAARRVAQMIGYDQIASTHDR